MIEQLYTSSVIAEHKKIAFNILRDMNNLQVNSQAPDFTLTNIKQDSVKLSNYIINSITKGGRFVYLNFFAPWCTDCLEQFKKQEQLHKKYGDGIVFISVDIEEDTTSLKKFLKQNPKYNWIFLSAANNKEVIAKYNAKSVPVYYLVSPQGYLIQSPAWKPDEGIERKFNEILKIKPKKVGK